MKKSELYHLAQVAVINSPCLTPEAKIEVLRVLISDEDVALYTERAAVKATETVAVEE